MSEKSQPKESPGKASPRAWVGTVQQLKAKYESMSWAMDERMRRLWAGNEALALGRGGSYRVAEATGLSRNTVLLGIAEIRQHQQQPAVASGALRRRRPGGGRPSLKQRQPTLQAALEALVDPVTRGSPSAPLRWTCKSLRRLAAELRAQGYAVSPPVVGKLLENMGYSLQANRKTREGASHPDRDAQFQHLAGRTQEFLQQGQPVISVDAKKKERVGNFKNGGREWEPQGSPQSVRLHDFGGGKYTPYGIYELARNCGWVSVGSDHDTAEFAVESVRRWWKQMGQAAYPQARRLLITADAGGSNGYRTRLWKLQLQQLADELQLDISVCHFPPGTSKWNKIEHRMFCHITQNWRARPLVSHEVVVHLIAATTTEKGLFIRAELDLGKYPKGLKVSDQQMAQLRIQPDRFHGEWNYTISPRTPTK